LDAHNQRDSGDDRQSFPEAERLMVQHPFRNALFLLPFALYAAYLKISKYDAESSLISILGRCCSCPASFWWQRASSFGA
jgi:hypothetical protein